MTLKELTLTDLVKDDPVRIYLGIPLRIQNHGLVGPEVREEHFPIVRTHVVHVIHVVSVQIVLTDVPAPVV